MNRSYLVLLAIALIVALALSALGRRTPHTAATAAPPPAAPVTAITIEVRGDAVTPGNLALPKDHRVRLTVVLRDGGPVSLRLAGYEDRVRMDSLVTGETRSLEFLADRPGGDFTWLVNGRPSGRLAVTGSHLVGDHR